MTFTGHNKYLKHIVYFTIYNRYLYVKGFNTGYQYLKNVMFRGVLEDPQEAFKEEYSCGAHLHGDCTDILDMTVPVEESMIPALMEMVLKDLTPAVYRPDDGVNNAHDRLGKVAESAAMQEQLRG